MDIIKATEEDINTLIKLRLDFLEADQGELSIAQKQSLTLQLQDYFIRHIPEAGFVAYFIKENNIIVATAFMVIQERPANLSFGNGKAATILNVLTYPEYRNKGYAFILMQKLIDHARSHDIHSIDLNASKMGISLYQKLGFKEVPYTAMHLKLE